MPEQKYNLEQVAIRMVEAPPLLSDTPIHSPEDAVRTVGEWMTGLDRELFCVVNLQSDMKPINMNVVSVGAINQSLVHPREVLKSAILSNAASIMVIHNHPSGSLNASQEDIEVTNRLQQAAGIMGIELMDHIIVGRGHEYFSFRDKDILPMETPRFSRVMDDVDLTAGVVAEAAPQQQYQRRGKDLSEIMESLEEGTKEIFEGGRYEEFLKTMSKFHRYSFNNTMLIAMQKPDASLVTGYNKWQSLGRQVKKGEKGIQIIAPAPYKMKKEREKTDGNQNPIYGSDGKPMMEEVEVTIPKFKVTTVFDISQTYGKPIEALSPEDLTADLQNYPAFMDAISKLSPVPIRFAEIENGAKGYFNLVDKEIVIQKGMSESQTMKTVIHEVAHAKLHDRDVMKAEGVTKDTQTKEVEAESCAFCVCNYFGLDTSDYSFPYIAGWSSGREMAELKSSMDTIRQTAGEFIEGIEAELKEVVRQQAAEHAEEQNAEMGFEEEEHADNPFVGDEAQSEVPSSEDKPGMKVPSQESITFYVAECAEFPVMGEYHEGLSMDEALKIYDEIPGDRINGIKGLGFELQDGNGFSGKYDLLVGGTVQGNLVNEIPAFRDSPAVQKALGEVTAFVDLKQKALEQQAEKVRESLKTSEKKATAKRAVKKQESKKPEPKTTEQPKSTKKKRESVAL